MKQDQRRLAVICTLWFAEEESRRKQFAKNYPTLTAASLQEQFNSDQFFRRKKTGLDLIGKQMKKIEADWQEPLLNPETR